MSNVQSKPVDIYSRIDSFVLKTLLIIRTLPKNLECIEITKQLIRSVCSIGANANEADGTLTRNEFLHTFSIARREAKETDYWLRLLLKLYPHLSNQLEPTVKECNELVAILSKIIQTSRNKHDL